MAQGQSHLLPTRLQNQGASDICRQGAGSVLRRYVKAMNRINGITNASLFLKAYLILETVFQRKNRKLSSNVYVRQKLSIFIDKFFCFEESDGLLHKPANHF